MVTVYSRSNTICVHRSTYCSAAFVFLIILYACVIILPAIIVHHSHGLWRRLELFSEQPKIDFKKEFILVTESSNGSVASWGKPQQMRLLNTTRPLRMTHLSSDSNFDLKPEYHNFEIDIDLENITGIRLLLKMEARLQKLAVLVSNCLVWIDHSSSAKGQSLTVAANLKLITSFVLPFKSHNNFLSKLDFTQPMEDILKQYSEARAKCILEGVTKIWRPSTTGRNGFKMCVTLNIFEQPFYFRPGLAYMFKYAWIQYFSLMAVLAGIAIRLKKFVFENQIIETYCVDMKVL